MPEHIDHTITDAVQQDGMAPITVLRRLYNCLSSEEVEKYRYAAHPPWPTLLLAFARRAVGDLSVQAEKAEAQEEAG